MPADLSCGGYCSECGKVHSLPSERALPHARNLMEALAEHRRLDFDRPFGQANPKLSTDWLYSDMRGKMFGVLVCEDMHGNEIVLKAFSSKYNDHRTIAGWAGPLVDPAAFDAEIEAGNRFIHPLTEQIAQHTKGSAEYQRLVAERKDVSHVILAKLLAHYTIRNFRNEARTLREAFLPDRPIPIGTGDCCAPKLLNAAILQGLKPLSIAEFFWGKATASGDRQEGQFYPSCKERCEPLLGFMLCGATTFTTEGTEKF